MTVAELPSPYLASTKIMGAEVAAGTRVPLVVVDMPAAELGLPVGAACTAP